jgi:hypothetical protein
MMRDRFSPPVSPNSSAADLPHRGNTCRIGTFSTRSRNPHGGNDVSQHSLDIRLGQADRLARATGPDMADVGWRPTVGNYLGRVTKLASIRRSEKASAKRPRSSSTRQEG